MNEFTCENCQHDYFTTSNWDDECYCEGCYFELFPVPEWYKEKNEMPKWETIGHIGVDSGTVMVGDPCYVVPDHLWSAWCDEYQAGGGFDAKYLEMGDGTISVTTPHGDGEYAVKARRNSQGQIVEIRIQLGWDDE